jgi:phospholipid/cholesterol/gamma-HCH transport system permease protein
MPEQGWRSEVLALCRPAIAFGNWLATAMGVAAAVVYQGARPTTWRRRPVRAEFLRFLDLASVQSIPAVIVTGAFVGLALITQALFWLDQFGEADRVFDIIDVVLIREIAPLFVGFLMLGRSGLVILSELGEMRQQGQCRMLDARGVDPFLLFVVPRVLATAIGVFCLTIVFLLATYGVGVLAGHAIGVSDTPLVELLSDVLYTVGNTGYAIVPLKTLGIGFVIGVVCCLTALEGPSRNADVAHLIPRGFIRSVLAIFAVSGLLSITL